MKRVVKLTLGWIFIVLGVAGLVLPFLQGILFLAIGATLLAQESPWAHEQLQKLRRRYPAASATLDRTQERAEATMARLMARLTAWFGPGRVE